MVRGDELTAVIPMAQYHASRFTGTSLGRDDAFGYGCLAAVEAASRYRPESGVPFLAYAARRVRGAMQDAAKSVHGFDGEANIEVLADDSIRSASHFDHPFGVERILRALSGLSFKEKHLALLIAAGYTRREVATAWGVSESRISQRLSAIRSRMEWAVAA